MVGGKLERTIFQDTNIIEGWILCRSTYIRSMQIMGFHLQFYELLYIYSVALQYFQVLQKVLLLTQPNSR